MLKDSLQVDWKFLTLAVDWLLSHKRIRIDQRNYRLGVYQLASAHNGKCPVALAQGCGVYKHSSYKDIVNNIY